MAYENMPGPVLDYAPCRYGRSKLMFRGPAQRLNGDFIAVLGGSETYGRYLTDPYPALLQDETGVKTVNLGYVNAGVDVFLNDETILEACRRARAVVLQVTGAQNLSNRFYTVHPRRNDRFVKASPMMKAVFPEVDFTEFHFTGHMLATLSHTSAARFALIRDELRRVWVQRMNLLMAQIGRPVVILWMAERTPDDPAETIADGGPMFVNRTMLRSLRGRVADIVEYCFAGPDGIGSLDGKVFTETESQAAALMPGPTAHEAVAVRLSRVLREKD
ncbi:DUF6473 family protein [Oceaniglobus ichthyenteri]|uniref:DUF6473 family protein n=1 Tax=Oceaniglobus ichthyenteri TaxID=2136177 RepID=UPI000D34A9A7|nr:DUF6473 family protein [Oceaniglobus ichthyenteri]